MKNNLSVSFNDTQQADRAQAFSQHHGLPCAPRDKVDSDLTLCFTDNHVELVDLQCATSIHVDFIGGALAHRKKYGGGRGQAIARAIGLKPGTQPPVVLDATAGLGKDAFVMACLGCNMTLVERSPVVAALLEDAISRASDEEDFSAIIDQGFTLVNSNAIQYIQSLADAQRPQVIYLDPMYPQRKKSAQVKKNMQLLQKLLGQDEDTEQLLASALHCASKRVVVKRPKGAKIIGSLTPTTSIESRKTRYDVYVCKLFDQ